jgi:hypothetical protein
VTGRPLGRALALALACSCALAAASPRKSDLDLYRDALYLDWGLTCFAVGLRGEAIEHASARLSDRRSAIGRALRLRLGEATVEAVETEMENSLNNTDYSGCTLDQAAEGRRQLGWKLRALERRLGLPSPS